MGNLVIPFIHSYPISSKIVKTILAIIAKDFYYEKLDNLFPTLKYRYIRQYGDRYSCSSPNAKRLYQVFAEECDRLGVLYKMSDIIKSYKAGYGDRQLSLF